MTLHSVHSGILSLWSDLSDVVIFCGFGDITGG